MKIGDLVIVSGNNGQVGTVVKVDPPSKRRMRLAMVLFPDSGIDAYPEGWLEVNN